VDLQLLSGRQSINFDAIVNLHHPNEGSIPFARSIYYQRLETKCSKNALTLTKFSNISDPGTMIFQWLNRKNISVPVLELITTFRAPM
jgi:hypothetical protein